MCRLRFETQNIYQFDMFDQNYNAVFYSTVLGKHELKGLRSFS